MEKLIGGEGRNYGNDAHYALLKRIFNTKEMNKSKIKRNVKRFQTSNNFLHHTQKRRNEVHKQFQVQLYLYMYSTRCVMDPKIYILCTPKLRINIFTYVILQSCCGIYIKCDTAAAS
jgi:hypothetical protein